MFYLLDLISFFRANDPPQPGEISLLPNNLSFQMGSREVGVLSKVLIARKCYARVTSIIESLNTKKQNGVIFTGPQGNGKVCNLFIK